MISKRVTNDHLWDTFVFFFVEAAKIAFRETWSCNKSLSLNFCIETPLNNVPMPSSKAKLRIILLGQKCQFPKAILNNLYVRHILYFTSDKITFPPQIHTSRNTAEMQVQYSLHSTWRESYFSIHQSINSYFYTWLKTTRDTQGAPHDLFDV